jgi:hypothetical protein
LDFHHYKDPVEDQEEMVAGMVAEVETVVVIQEIAEIAEIQEMEKDQAMVQVVVSVEMMEQEHLMQETLE